MPVGVDEYGPELLFLQTVKLCGRLFFILLQRRQFLQYFDRIQKGPPMTVSKVGVRGRAGIIYIAKTTELTAIKGEDDTYTAEVACESEPDAGSVSL